MVDQTIPPRSLDEAIGELDPDQAARILAAMSRDPDLGLVELEIDWSPELGEAIGQGTGVPADASTLRDQPPATTTRGGGVSPEAGEVARLSLLVLAQDPDPRVRARLESLVLGGQPLTRGPITAALVITGALIALQTRFRFQRHADGTFEVEIKNEGTPIEVLKPLAESLLGLFKGGAGG